MESWRRLSLIGIVLGIGVQIIDSFILDIPYAVIIPLQSVAIGLIFLGLIIRKKQRDM